MKIAIRMDDITPNMDWEKFNKFKTICDKYNIKPLIGVVPHNQDDNLHIEESRDDFWDYIKELQRDGWVVAQHGSYHVYKTRKMGLFPLNRLSEYAGLPYDEQFRKIQESRSILKEHGIDTDIFMAPAHSYDKKTLKALKQNGFTRITDGFGKTPYVWNGLTFYPISFRQSSSLKKKDGYTTFVVHANTMNDKDFDRYDKLISERREDFISFGEYLEVQSRKRSFIGKVAESCKAYLKFILVQKL